MNTHTLHAVVSLLRLDKPIGIFLLLWPCFFGIAMASFTTQQSVPWSLYGLFALGAVIMRSAGCVMNDLCDRKIDAQVARTQLRPLASGALTQSVAIILFILLSVVGLWVLVQLPRITLLIGLVAFMLLVTYPLTKRFFPLPQLYLGITFTIGALMGYSAVAGELHFSAWWLYAACIAWTLGYDTIYAHQDVQDDQALGLHSSARFFGRISRYVVMACYECFYITILVLLVWRGWPEIDYIGAAVLLLLYLFTEYSLWKLDLQDPQACRRFFQLNGWIGFAIWLVLWP